MAPDWAWMLDLSGALLTIGLGVLTVLVLWRQVLLTRQLHQIEERRDTAVFHVEMLNAFDDNRFAMRILNRGGHASAIDYLRLTWEDAAGEELEHAYAQELVPHSQGIDEIRAWQEGMKNAANPAEGRILQPGERATVPFECRRLDVFAPPERGAFLAIRLEPVIGSIHQARLKPGEVHEGRHGEHRHYHPV